MKVGLVMEGGGQETDGKNNKQVDICGFREFDTIICLRRIRVPGQDLRSAALGPGHL